MDCSTPGSCVLHYLPEFAYIYVSDTNHHAKGYIVKIPSSSPKTRPSSDPAQIIVVNLIIPEIFYVCINNPYIIFFKFFHFLPKWLSILNIVYIAFFDNSFIEI